MGADQSKENKETDVAGAKAKGAEPTEADKAAKAAAAAQKQMVGEGRRSSARVWREGAQRAGVPWTPLAARPLRA